MNIPLKLGAYTLGLAVVFGAAAGLGSVVSPATQDTAPHSESHAESPMDASAQQAPAATHLPGGLQISQDGYTLDVPDIFPAGAATPVSFRILGPGGQPVTAYDTRSAGAEDHRALAAEVLGRWKKGRG